MLKEEHGWEKLWRLAKATQPTNEYGNHELVGVRVGRGQKFCFPVTGLRPFRGASQQHEAQKIDSRKLQRSNRAM